MAISDPCPMCDGTGLKDYAGFGMDLCECQAPQPASRTYRENELTLPLQKEAA